MDMETTKREWTGPNDCKLLNQTQLNQEYTQHKKPYQQFVNETKVMSGIPSPTVGSSNQDVTYLQYNNIGWRGTPRGDRKND